MKQFSQLHTDKTRDNFLYSELLALAYCNIEFFKFVEEEKNRYLMNDKVFENQFIYELRNHNISIEVGCNIIFPVCIEKDWEYLKDIFAAAIALRKEIPSYETVLVKPDNCIMIDSKIIAGKSKQDMINVSDLEQVIGVSKQELYENNFDELVSNTITIFQQYMKPEYMELLNYFLDIYEESGLEMNYANYKNFKVQGLGIKVDVLPKLCYNNLADFCKDVADYEPAFRDYSLMLDILEDFKHQNFNIEILIPAIKGNDKKEGFMNMVSKMYGLKDSEYLRIDSKNVLVKLPSKSEYLCDNLTEKYKLDSKNNFYLCLICDNVEVRICIKIGQVPYEIDISNKLVENIDYERFI